MHRLTLQILSQKFNVHHFPQDAKLPSEIFEAIWFSVTKTEHEISAVVPEDVAIVSGRCETGWKALEVAGVLDLGLVGILASLSSILAKAGISLFAVSTYDTDYIFVKEEKLAPAVTALRAAGYTVSD